MEGTPQHFSFPASFQQKNSVCPNDGIFLSLMGQIFYGKLRKSKSNFILMFGSFSARYINFLYQKRCLVIEKCSGKHLHF